MRTSLILFSTNSILFFNASDLSFVEAKDAEPMGAQDLLYSERMEEETVTSLGLYGKERTEVTLSPANSVFSILPPLLLCSFLSMATDQSYMHSTSTVPFWSGPQVHSRLGFHPLRYYCLLGNVSHAYNTHTDIHTYTLFA